MNARVERFSTADGRDAVGFEALAGIRERLAGGAALIVNGERGFSRIGSRLAQHIELEPPRITSRVLVLQEVHGDVEAIERLLTRLNHFSESYRYVYDAVTGTVSSHQSAIVDAATLDGWTPLLATAFALQFQRADEDADRLLKPLGGRIASAGSPHILKFRRPVRPKLRLASGPRPAGDRRNRFADRFEFDAIAGHANCENAFSAGASAEGVAIDAPFDRTTALLRLHSDREHPRAGEGLSVFLLLPIFGRFDEIARIAAWLNRREAEGEILVQGIGAWSVVEEGEKSLLRHCLFVPKDAWAPGLALNLSIAMREKLRRINALLNPGVPEPDVQALVASRLGRP